MDEPRQSAVLFADLSGSTKLYESAGDAAAMEAVERCLGLLRQATESSGGRVVKTIGDEVMALFASADAAASAAAEMQSAIAALPAVGDTSLGVRIGFQFGPVMQREGDVYGDTVNLAARLVGVAVKGQIITSSETMAMLGPLFRRWTRRLYSIQVKGKANEVELCELLWNQSAENTTLAAERSQPGPRSVALRLRYRGAERALRRNPDSLTLGRDLGAGMVISDNMASRIHCTIERRQDKYVLADHSSNGTFVAIAEEPEVCLRREEVMLRARGRIGLGHRTTDAEATVVEFTCE